MLELIKLRSILFICLLLSIFLFNDQTVNAQQALRLTHEKTERVKYIKLGNRIFSRTNDKDKKYIGRMKEIRDSIILVNGKEVKLADIKFIGKRPVGVEVLKVVGMVAGIPIYIFGTGQMLFGAAFMINGLVSAEPLFYLGGFLDVHFGGLFRLLGSSPWFLGFKKYRPSRGWQISVVGSP